ncbi:MAG: UDP-3-O-(3-hydroxymyristoyl)glucosamine N-acyltransferase [Acidobacteriaceae bacterium]
MRLTELAKALGESCELGGHADPEVSGVSSARLATAAELVFAEDEAALAAGLESDAAAVVVRPGMVDAGCGRKAMLVAGHPKLAFARAARLLRPVAEVTGVDACAAVSETAVLGDGVSIGPYAVIGSGAVIGAGTRIEAGAVIGDGVKVGAGCRIYPRVVVYAGTELGDRVVVHAGAVLGGDGFGYVRDGKTGEYVQFPQQGRLVIEDDVEIGANTTIDRGALEETRIARGVKIDNLVHLGHNVSVGPNVVIAALTGISGSSRVGAGAVVGGQVGMGDHASIGEGVIVGSGAGILPHKHLRGAGTVFWGTPAKPLRTYLKELATLAKLARRGSGDGN